jgi:hypothetical protein
VRDDIRSTAAKNQALPNFIDRLVRCRSFPQIL